MGATDYQALFIDGAKIESRAGRYTFVWRKSIGKHLDQVKVQVRMETGLATREELETHLAESRVGITFVKRASHRKSEEQKRWAVYENSLSAMVGERNSCSKADPDATFMRLKEDLVRNGQLKPAYNVQIAVNSEYITGIELFSDHSGVKTLKPFLRKLEKFHQARYKGVTADAGYENLENHLYLDAAGQTCLIQPANRRKKTIERVFADVKEKYAMHYTPYRDLP